MITCWRHIDHFRREEFDDPLVPLSGNHIDGHLLFNLVLLRRLTRWPMIIHGYVGGAVDMEGSHGHAPNSYHLYSQGCRAVDFHFVTDAPIALQYNHVCRLGFPGIGVYYDWLNPGFHVDMRPPETTQHWKRIDGEYIYHLPNNPNQKENNQ